MVVLLNPGVDLRVEELVLHMHRVRGDEKQRLRAVLRLVLVDFLSLPPLASAGSASMRVLCVRMTASTRGFVTFPSLLYVTPSTTGSTTRKRVSVFPPPLAMVDGPGGGAKTSSPVRSSTGSSSSRRSS